MYMLMETTYDNILFQLNKKKTLNRTKTEQLSRGGVEVVFMLKVNKNLTKWKEKKNKGLETCSNPQVTKVTYDNLSSRNYTKMVQWK